MQAKFVSGTPETINGVASGDIAAGDVLIVGETTRIAILPVEDGELGAFAAGGGLYLCTCLDTAGITNGTKIYWDNANDGVTKDATAGGAPFGFAGEDGTVGELMLCHHNPAVS